MSTLTVDCRSLSLLLTQVARPGIDRVVCSAAERLSVTLEGVALPFPMGHAGPVVVELLVMGRRTDDRTIEIHWEIGEVSGAPKVLVRTFVGFGAVKRVLEKLCARLKITAAVVIGSDSIALHLDRIPASRKGIHALMRVRSFTIPGKRGQALSAQVELEAPPTRPKRARVAR
ncbi:MAG: hypothetical protein H0V44_00255 [Planctomycetes bacterium]|nr:hypothetical protein [Planctomycetota bacterium]